MLASARAEYVYAFRRLLFFSFFFSVCGKHECLRIPENNTGVGERMERRDLRKRCVGITEKTSCLTVSY